MPTTPSTMRATHCASPRTAATSTAGGRSASSAASRHLASRRTRSQAALSSFGGTDSERQAALDVLRRRFRVAPRDDRERERALGLLVRRGYDLDLAYDVVRTFSDA